MQGYGSRRRRLLALFVAGLSIAGLGATITACSFSTDPGPTSLVLPPTDELTTQSSFSTSTSPSSTTRISETATELPDWSIGRVISLAPRADNARYHDGSTGPHEPLEETSGFHFSTPDRSINCSTVAGGSLACRLNSRSPDGSAPPGTPTGCDWQANLATLDSRGPQNGACADTARVLYRSAIVDVGTTITVGRFSCLVSTADLYCLESSSNTGFAIGATGYRKIYANQRAPRTLLGLTESDVLPSPSTHLDDSDSSPSPTPTR